jgi:hypothetical protein
MSGRGCHIPLDDEERCYHMRLRYSDEEIFRVLSLMPDVQYVNSISPDREEDLVRVVEPLSDGFSEEPVLVRQSERFSGRCKLPYRGSNPMVPPIRIVRGGTSFL